MPGFISHERLAFGPWQALERSLVRLIEHAGFGDVTLVGGTGDLGADVVGTAEQQELATPEQVPVRRARGLQLRYARQ